MKSSRLITFLTCGLFTITLYSEPTPSERKSTSAREDTTAAMAIMRDSQFPDFPAAEKLLKQAIEKDPKLTEAHFQLGTVFYFEGRLAESEASFMRAIELNPKIEGAYNNIGYSYIIRDKYEEALPYFEKELKTNPAYALSHRNRAICYTMLKRLKEAQESINKAAELGYTFDMRADSLFTNSGLTLPKR